MSIRPATEADMDAITWISVAALPADPICPYRFPFMDKYPDDHEKFTRLRYMEYLAAGDSAIMVFECPSLEDPNVNKAVAFSIWQLPGTHVKFQTDSEKRELFVPLPPSRRNDTDVLLKRKRKALQIVFSAEMQVQHG